MKSPEFLSESDKYKALKAVSNRGGDVDELFASLVSKLMYELLKNYHSMTKRDKTRNLQKAVSEFASWQKALYQLFNEDISRRNIKASYES